jgi:hypothetical protein
MKLGDPNLDRQLRAGVDRYEQLPSWVKEASFDRAESCRSQSDQLSSPRRVDPVQEEA